MASSASRRLEVLVREMSSEYEIMCMYGTAGVAKIVGLMYQRSKIFVGKAKQW